MHSTSTRRASHVASVVLLTLASWLAIRAARNFRGSASFCDASLPLAILGPSNLPNVLWATQIQLTLGLCLITLAAWLLSRDATSPRRLAAFGLVLATFPLCGANTLAYVPALALWLLAFAPGARRLWALPSLGLLVFYFVNYHKSPQHAAAEGLGAIGRTLVQFASLAAGLGARSFWPVAGGLVLALVAATSVTLLRRAWREREPSRRASFTALVALEAGAVCLALGLAFGRAGSGPRIGLEDRYVTMAVPLLVTSYLALGAHGFGRLAQGLSLTILTVSLVLLWPSAEQAITAARSNHQQHQAVEASLRERASLSTTIRRHTPLLHPYHDSLARVLPALRRAGVEPFTHLADDPPAHWVAISTVPASTTMAHATVDRSTFQVDGVDPWLTFRLDRPTPVLALRLRYDHGNPEGLSGRFVLMWANIPGQSLDDPSRRFPLWSLPTGVDRSITLHLGTQLSAFRIQPDNTPGQFRLRSIELLVPDQASAH